MDYAYARLNMVENQLRPSRIFDERLLEAMLEVPRERFVPKALRGVAYADEDLVLPGGYHLIEPLVLARMIEAVRVQSQDVALLLGCSTGYAGAILARMAGTVIIVEPDDETAAQVERLLDDLGADNVVMAVNPDPLAGHPDQAPFDAIILTGATPSVPPALLDQLGEGGRLVAVVEKDRIGKGTLFTRLHGIVGDRELFDAQIPLLPGAVRPAEFAF